MEDDCQVLSIHNESDIVTARQVGRKLAQELGFSGSDITLIATAISELARNIIVYAHRGEVILNKVHVGSRIGILIVAQDQGPGISDIQKAMEDGYSTGHSLGLGLPGAKRMMDEFAIVSEVGVGTKVTMKKWAP